ncbi:uncharacterized protein LOC127096466 [Lathyrus oleraceus]|uniref:uncharacterized protein LOC127096466 n=1 Tax=Pisum sativum TaxID=3888 RepID=UPI0021D0B012|nr:uncharacterized protein LOC127096466 [Pisum sativum]
MSAAKKNTKGPLDVIYYREPEETLKKGKQTSLNEACDKKARACYCQYIARFFYRNGIVFNVANSKSFKLMVEPIGMYGAHLKPPSYYELRVPLLQYELKLTHEMLSTNKQEQLVTDNVSNYVLDGKHLQVSRPKIFWTPFVVHSLDLMLEEKLESELVRSGVTRFATNFLTLHRLQTLNAKFRTMFTSEEWLNLNASKEVKGKKASVIVLQVSFWEDIVYTLKAMGTLVKVRRLVDHEKKSTMSNIYHAMLEANELITKNFNNNENKYKDIIDIVDSRWSIQLHHPLHAAGYYLNLKHFYSNPMIENDDKLLDGLYACIDKLYASV